MTTATTASSATTAATTGTSAAPAAGNTTGVTSSTINLAEIADVGGPVPGLFQGAENGIDAWAAYVNANGGIDGRKVTIDFKDSALSCTTYTTDLQGLVNSTFAAVGSFAIFDSCGKSTLVAHPSYPDVQAAIENPSLNPLPNVYAPAPTPPGTATTGYQYIKDEFPTAITHTAAMYGAAVTQIYEEEVHAAESIGYKYVYADGLSDTATNFTSDILRMKADGVKIVDMQDCDAIEVADFFQQAQQQGFHPDALLSAASYDPGFFTDLGSADASALVMNLPNELYLGKTASTLPIVQSFIKYMGVVHAQPDLFALDAFAAGLLFEQAMKAAGPNPSRSALLAQLPKITNFDAQGLIGPTNPGGKVPGVCDIFAGVKDGQYVKLAPSGSGYDCKGTFVPYTASS